MYLTCDCVYILLSDNSKFARCPKALTPAPSTVGSSEGSHFEPQASDRQRDQLIAMEEGWLWDAADH